MRWSRPRASRTGPWRCCLMWRRRLTGCAPRWAAGRAGGAGQGPHGWSSGLPLEAHTARPMAQLQEPTAWLGVTPRVPAWAQPAVRSCRPAPADPVCTRVPGGGGDWRAAGGAPCQAAQTERTVHRHRGCAMVDKATRTRSGALRLVVGICGDLRGGGFPVWRSACESSGPLPCRPCRSSTWWRRRGAAACRATAPSCSQCGWPRRQRRWRDVTR